MLELQLIEVNIQQRLICIIQYFLAKMIDAWSQTNAGKICLFACKFIIWQEIWYSIVIIGKKEKSLKCIMQFNTKIIIQCPKYHLIIIADENNHCRDF